MKYYGYVKFFHKNNGYGFLTITHEITLNTDNTLTVNPNPLVPLEEDVFVHVNDINPERVSYPNKTLFTGEYVTFDIEDVEHKGVFRKKAVNVTGGLGSHLLCDKGTYRFTSYKVKKN